MIFFYLVIIVLFFLVLGKSADFVVTHVKKISKDYKIPIVFSGLILGFFTSAPEFFIGIKSTSLGVNAISYGNLIGGIIVLFGLVAPLQILLNKGIRIKNVFSVQELVAILIFLILQVVFMLNGSIHPLEGSVLFILYFALINFISLRETAHQKNFFLDKKHLREFFFIILGLIAISISSHFIVTVSLRIIGAYRLPLFLVGLTAFSIGTNLPELILTVRSWQKKSKDLAFGNMIGSAITNVLIIAILSIARPIKLVMGPSFFILLFFFVFLCILFIVLAVSGKRFTQREGLALLAVYIVFIITQIFTTY